MCLSMSFGVFNQFFLFGVQPFVELSVVLVVFYFLLKPNRRFEVFQLLDEIVEEILGNFLGNEGNQALGQEWNVVVNQRIPVIRCFLIAYILQLHREVLEVQ